MATSFAGSSVVRSMPMFEGDVFLGDIDVFLSPGMEGHRPVFSSNQIRISRRSPASSRCHPLAVLQVISAFSMRCKLRSKKLDLHPRSLLVKLHTFCLEQRMTAVVDAGVEELHLVAMPSKLKGVPCFWCWSAQTGLYTECLGMLNQRCLAIVCDLDETVVLSNNEDTFRSHIGKIESDLENCELDAATELTLIDELNKIRKDNKFLMDFTEKGTITVNHEILTNQNEEGILHKPGGGQQLIVRPVIRFPGRNAVLTRIRPTVPKDSFFVNIRPGWDDLKSYLIATNGRRRYKVYVCTMAGRDYALEAWRLLDPKGSLISLEEISRRLICVRPDSKKSLEHVFQESLCHPNMTMVIDDRMDVWDEKDKRRVHNLPAYNPSVAPEDKVAHGLSVLQIVRTVTWNVRRGFFSDFDGVLLKIIDGLMYENDVLDLPYAPDVGDYLQRKSNKIVRHDDSPMSPMDTSAA
uniref:Uncharacterized protein n=1 Tax=Avena sativa TaxID=4498 RepID=A0ACD5UG43_AVESA